MFKATSPDLPFPRKSFRIKQEDDKFFSRTLSKETSIANPSFRVYYDGVSVAVPFVWESQPGTPKYSKFCEKTLPPLTPPPSSYFNTSTDHRPIKNKHSRSNLFHFLFPRIRLKKKSKALTSDTCPSSDSTLSPSPSSASSSWSSLISSSSLRFTSRKCHHRSRRSSFDSGAYSYEYPSSGSPTSTLCFGVGKWKRDGVLRRENPTFGH
ncbi:hypothetical protein K2173_000047 [Erythroxylum novogranatense]|uniref:Uncharacterized protein n=1 Tax=Erythroxylum novogranatense TaxID=1862640 RepID=A0AAV8SNL7_9ROSI|nr:hypothetical protein K2173_000047 [Erythroxylum novogranatense]